MPHPPNRVMPRKRRKARPPAAGTPSGARRRQYNIGFMPAVAARIDATAEALGLDPSQLLRMIVHEKLAEYEARAKASRPDTDK